MGRKVMCFLLLMVTFLFAGFFLSRTLILLFWMALFLLVGMYALAYGLSRHIELSLPLQEDTVEKGTVLSGAFQVKNSSFLPVSDCRFLVEYEHIWERKAKKKRKKKMTRCSVAGKTTKSVPFQLSSQHCRILNLSVSKIYVWDYLNFFSVGKKTAAAAEVLVLPPMQKLLVQKENDAEIWQNQEHSQSLFASAEPESFDLRQYYEGAHPKSIHWKLYARTGDLWVRTYEAEKAMFLTFFLDFYYFDTENLKFSDAFWEIMTAVCFGLLEQNICCTVCWYDFEKNEIQKSNMKDREDYQRLMRRLYRMRGASGQSYAAYQEVVLQSLPEVFLSLDGKLLLSYQKEAQIQFHEETYQEEIRKRWLVL